MKKIYALSAAMVLSLAMLTACGSTKESEEDSVSQTQTTESADAAASTIDVTNLETKNLSDYDMEKFVQLGDYVGNTLEATKAVVSDADVEDSLNGAFTASPLMNEVTGRAVQDGDTVNIDYEGKFADTLEAFQGGTAQGSNLVIGSGTFIDGFESGLIGVNIGDTVDLNLTFPENYGKEELAGKDVVFTVKVNSISVADKEPSDKWVESLGLDDAKTLDEYRALLKKQMEEDAEEEYKTTLMNEAIEVATQNSTVDNVPEELYNRYYKLVYESVESYVQQMAYVYGIQGTVEDYISSVMQSNGISGTAADYLSDVANQQAKRSMVVQAIADKEKISVSDKEIDEYIQSYYDAYYSQVYSTFDEFKETLDLEEYRESLLTDKVAEFLVENDTVVEAQ